MQHVFFLHCSIKQLVDCVRVSESVEVVLKVSPKNKSEGNSPKEPLLSQLIPEKGTSQKSFPKSPYISNLRYSYQAWFFVFGKKIPRIHGVFWWFLGLLPGPKTLLPLRYPTADVDKTWPTRNHLAQPKTVWCSHRAWHPGHLSLIPWWSCCLFHQHLRMLPKISRKKMMLKMLPKKQRRSCEELVQQSFCLN